MDTNSPSPELVELIFQKLFGNAPDSDALHDALLGYTGNEPDRVRLAILKLSRGDGSQLRHYCEAAALDYRDVLAWAESPGQMSTHTSRFNTSQEAQKEMLTKDRAQYQEWIDSVIAETDPDADD
jgi:hypothetical protein